MARCRPRRASVFNPFSAPGLNQQPIFSVFYCKHPLICNLRRSESSLSNNSRAPVRCMQVRR